MATNNFIKLIFGSGLLLTEAIAQAQYHPGRKLADYLTCRNGTIDIDKYTTQGPQPNGFKITINDLALIQDVTDRGYLLRSYYYRPTLTIFGENGLETNNLYRKVERVNREVKQITEMFIHRFDKDSGKFVVKIYDAMETIIPNGTPYPDRIVSRVGEPQFSVNINCMVESQ